jgi:ABC-type oligopeptide transport system substrate-binding subunit
LNPLADLPIIPAHVWSSIDKPLEQTTQLPIGSGPYRRVEYV